MSMRLKPILWVSLYEYEIHTHMHAEENTEGGIRLA